MMAVLLEEVLEVLCSSVEGSFGAGRATALPELAEVALLFQAVSDVGGGGQSQRWEGAGGLGVEVQPAHWMVSVKIVTASSMSAGVLRGT
jgi:hypothetical protein